MKINYHVLPNSIVLNFDGKTIPITKANGNYEKVLNAIRNNQLDTIPSLVDAEIIYSDSDLKFKDNLLYLDGEALPDSLHDRILAFKNENLPFEHLVKFARKLRLNPSFNSRQQLLKFLEHNGHPITTEGNFIAYRGVTKNFKDLRTRTFNNSVGSICEMPRDSVDDNPNNTCSNGLHVACYNYAKNFGPQLIEVEVDPKDVVAVPTDYNGTKMRVCKFKVVNVSKNIREENLVNSSYNDTTTTDIDYTESDWDYCDDLYSEKPKKWISLNLENNSSLIMHASWEETQQILNITFKDGSVYEYYNVPISEVCELEMAASHGKYFKDNIAHSYNYSKL